MSFWLACLNNLVAAPFFISEAINEDKRAYYDAVSNTRDTNNDLTYFLGYIFETSTKFSLCGRKCLYFFTFSESFANANIESISSSIFSCGAPSYGPIETLEVF